MHKKTERHIPIKDGERPLLECLREHIGLSNQQLKRVLQNGAVWLETGHGIQRVRRAKRLLQPGETLHVYYDPRVQAETPPAAQLITDEGDYSIWNKPSGMYSQGSKWGDHCTLYRWAEKNLLPQRSAFIVHRLDRAACGLMILAHSKGIAAKFSAMFQCHEIHKQYRARVAGIVDPATLPMEITTPIDDRPARSIVIASVTDEQTGTSTLEVSIETGRKHQIRRHLAEMGHPIIGDRLHGEIHTDLDLQLCSAKLGFTCPLTGEEREYTLTDCP